jgi:subtilase family serine protease
MGRGVCCAALVSALVLLAAPISTAAAAPVAHATAVGPAPSSQPLQLVLPLVVHDAGLAQLAQAISTPGSPEYAHYEAIQQLARRFGASPATRARVIRYLRAAGATEVRIDATGMFADATMTAARAERVFATPLTAFRSGRHSQFIAPNAAVGVPRALQGVVQGVIGLDTQPLSGPRRAEASGLARKAHAASQPTSAFPRTGTPSGCRAGVAAGELGNDPATAGFTPNQYLTAYGFGQLQAAGFGGQGERVALIEIDGFKLSDIDAFAQCFGLHVPPVNAFSVGVKHLLAPGGESTLDLETLDAAAPDLKAIDVYESNSSAADTLEAMTAPLQNHGRQPEVISASLGLCEPAVYAAIGVHGIEATEAALEIAALSGVTFLASSGDSGSADCLGPDGFPIDRLAVNYPASSAWVTGVGGTNLLLGPANQITNQVVWNDTDIQPGSAAGGGSSAVFRRPFYQEGTITAASRAVPDVSMLGDIIPGYAVFCSAQGECINSGNSNPWQSVGGTSASTPLLAGGFALVDQELRMHNRLDLGLANPLLYQLGRSPTLSGQVFDDILSYGNDVGPFIPGDGQALGCCTAIPGYDRASGWGSVNVAALAPLAVSMQPPQIGLSLPGGQKPIHHRQILARVSCAGACRIGAYAVITIAHEKPFSVESGLYRIGATGARTIPIRFSRKELRRLQAAMSGHHRVSATVYGVLITGRRRIEFQTGGRRIGLGG